MSQSLPNLTNTGAWDKTLAEQLNTLSAAASAASAGITSLTGEVTASGPGAAAATLSAKAVTLGKMADMATASLIYRKSGGTGSPEVNTLATLKTDLGLTGTNGGDQTITLGGDASGSGTSSITVANNKLAGVTPSAYGLTLIDDADAPTARTTLGLGTLATQSGTFSGTSSGTNTGDQTVPVITTCRTTSQATSTSTTLANVTNFKHTLAANTSYMFTFFAPVSSAATGTAIRIGLTWPTGATCYGRVDIPQAINGTASFYRAHIATSGGVITETSKIAGTQMLEIQGIITTAGTAGNLQFQLATSVNGSQVALDANACGTLTTIA